jgi:hypothetical protein
MMRRRLASFVLLTACLLMLGSAQASTAEAPKRPAIAASSKHSRSLDRVGPLSLAPAPNDLALAELSFPWAGAERLTARALHLALAGPFGDDYLAVSGTRFRTPGGPRALVLVVNRPSPLLDPIDVRLRLTWRRALGTPRVARVADPFTRRVTGHSPALCDLALHGLALRGSQLGALGSRGSPLAGFATTSAVAQAYDAVCGLPYASSFRQAITGSSSAVPAPAMPSPAPPAPVAPPAPAPPAPVPPPICAPCNPPPGSVCPLTLGPSVCAGTLEGSARRAATGAH